MPMSKVHCRKKEVAWAGLQQAPMHIPEAHFQQDSQILCKSNIIVGKELSQQVYIPWSLSIPFATWVLQPQVAEAG